jgi:hypothetical protein
MVLVQPAENNSPVHVPTAFVLAGFLQRLLCSRQSAGVNTLD